MTTYASRIVLLLVGLAPTLALAQAVLQADLPPPPPGTGPGIPGAGPGIMVVRGHHGPMPFGDDPGMMLPALLHGVGLTDDQQKQVRDILKTNHKTLFPLFDQLRSANEALADRLTSPDSVTEQDLQPLVDQVMTVRRNIVSQGLKVVLQVRQVLTPEQLAKAAEVKAKMRELRAQMHELLGEPFTIRLGDAD
jgi:Spy/CpxP family protein refolding chaperone